MYLLKRDAADICKEKWEIIDKYFNNDQEIKSFLSGPIQQALWDKNS
jgi:hypothetical protein